MEARVCKTVVICAHGAAHGAWKLMIWRVDGGRDAVCLSHSSSVVISVSVDMVAVVFLRQGEVIESQLSSYLIKLPRATVYRTISKQDLDRCPPVQSLVETRDFKGSQRRMQRI